MLVDEQKELIQHVNTNLEDAPNLTKVRGDRLSRHERSNVDSNRQQYFRPLPKPLIAPQKDVTKQVPTGMDPQDRHRVRERRPFTASDIASNRRLVQDGQRA